jgi:hypothetical protein
MPCRDTRENKISAGILESINLKLSELLAKKPLIYLWYKLCPAVSSSSEGIVDFVDATLLRIADAAGRQAVLDQTALESWAAAAFDLSVAPLQGPYALDVETAEFGIELPSNIVLDGTWSVPGGMPTDARFRIEGLRVGAPLRIDALWRGRLIARSVPQDSRVDLVSAQFAPSDIDAEIIAENGALPADTDAREAARRQKLLVRLRAGAAQPEAIGDMAVDAMLHTAGVETVGDLLAESGSTGLGAVRVRFSAPAAVAPAPVFLPVTIAVLVRDQPLQLAGLLSESRAIRAALAGDPASIPVPAQFRRRTPVLVSWIFPTTEFDDTGWPGADVAARRAGAISLLQGQGIGIATRAP